MANPVRSEENLHTGGGGDKEPVLSTAKKYIHIYIYVSKWDPKWRLFLFWNTSKWSLERGPRKVPDKYQCWRSLWGSQMGLKSRPTHPPPIPKREPSCAATSRLRYTKVLLISQERQAPPDGYHPCPPSGVLEPAGAYKEPFRPTTTLIRVTQVLLVKCPSPSLNLFEACS